MAENGKEGFFKLSLNLGHIVAMLGTISAILPFVVSVWIGQIQNDVVSHKALEDHTKALSDLTASMKATEMALVTHTLALAEIQKQVGSIDTKVQMAVVDDDRLMRVQADIKEIQARVEGMERRQTEKQVPEK
jgi:hypothetical protein